MPDQCHAVLKDYANAWDMTMSEVMYEAIGSYIYKHSECCGYINSLLTFRGVKTDKRVSKNCYGHPCFACKHRTACGAGLYEGSWEMNPEVQEYIDLNSPTTTSDTRVQPKIIDSQDTKYDDLLNQGTKKANKYIA